MNKQDSINRAEAPVDDSNKPRRHPITLENSPEETIRRMRSLPERSAKLRESLRALREANSR